MALHVIVGNVIPIGFQWILELRPKLLELFWVIAHILLGHMALRLKPNGGSGVEAAKTGKSGAQECRCARDGTVGVVQNVITHPTGASASCQRNGRGYDTIALRRLRLPSDVSHSRERCWSCAVGASISTGTLTVMVTTAHRGGTLHAPVGPVAVEAHQTRQLRLPPWDARRSKQSWQYGADGCPQGHRSRRHEIVPAVRSMQRNRCTGKRLQQVVGDRLQFVLRPHLFRSLHMASSLAPFPPWARDVADDGLLRWSCNRRRCRKWPT